MIEEVFEIFNASNLLVILNQLTIKLILSIDNQLIVITFQMITYPFVTMTILSGFSPYLR